MRTNSGAWPISQLLGCIGHPGNCSKQCWDCRCGKDVLDHLRWERGVQFPDLVWMNPKQERTLKWFSSFQAKENDNAVRVKLASQGTECKTTLQHLRERIGYLTLPAFSKKDSAFSTNCLKALEKPDRTLQGSPKNRRQE